MRDELRRIPPAHVPRQLHDRRRRLRPGAGASSRRCRGDGPTARSSIDFDGTSPQSGGTINASFSQTMSGVVYAVRCFVDPSDPDERGLLPRRSRTVLPLGIAREPGPARGVRRAGHDASPRRIEAILAALSQALARPRGRARASLIHVYSLTGIDDDGKPWVNLFYEFGGLGGRAGVDGPGRDRLLLPRRPVGDPTARAARGAVPVRGAALAALARLRGRRASGAAGSASRWSSSCMSPAELTVRGDRMELPAAGRARWARRRGGHVVSWSATDGTVEVLPTKAANVPVGPGERFVDAHVGRRRPRRSPERARSAAACSPTCVGGQGDGRGRGARLRRRDRRRRPARSTSTRPRRSRASRDDRERWTARDRSAELVRRRRRRRHVHRRRARRQRRWRARRQGARPRPKTRGSASSTGCGRCWPLPGSTRSTCRASCTARRSRPTWSSSDGRAGRARHDRGLRRPVAPRPRGARRGRPLRPVLHARPRRRSTRALTFEVSRARERQWARCSWPLTESTRSRRSRSSVAADRPDRRSPSASSTPTPTPTHERRRRRGAPRALPDTFVVASSEVWPEMREYERAMTTVDVRDTSAR